jgi:hypothetical protein
MGSFDQIISDFNQDIEAALTQRVAVDAVAGQTPIVGFIDANGEIPARL